MLLCFSDEIERKERRLGKGQLNYSFCTFLWNSARGFRLELNVLSDWIQVLINLLSWEQCFWNYLGDQRSGRKYTSIRGDWMRYCCWKIEIFMGLIKNLQEEHEEELPDFMRFAEMKHEGKGSVFRRSNSLDHQLVCNYYWQGWQVSLSDMS